MSIRSAFLGRRWPAVALVASLAVNGFFVGMFVADWLKPHGRGFSGERFSRFELRRFDERLPKDTAERIGEELKALGPQLDARIANLREIRAEIMRLAAVPEPQRAEIDAELALLRAETASMQEVVQQATYDALLALPPEDRVRLTEEPAR